MIDEKGNAGGRLGVRGVESRRGLKCATMIGPE